MKNGKTIKSYTIRTDGQFIEVRESGCKVPISTAYTLDRPEDVAESLLDLAAHIIHDAYLCSHARDFAPPALTPEDLDAILGRVRYRLIPTFGEVEA